MPSGIVWYHGTCSSGSNTMGYMSRYSELKGIDVMIADTDMNFATLNNNYYPETLIKDHDFNSPQPIPATVYEKYPTIHQTLRHNNTYRYIRPDYQPELITPLISPDSGDPSTEFDFSIIYKYRPDKAPDSARVLFEGIPYNMTTTAPEGWRTGVKYQFSTTLPPGQVEYHYEFEVDGKMVRLPAEGEFQGPLVNALPELMETSVSPEEGDDDMEYTFSVKFMDGDGEPAIERYLIIDGDKKGMSTQGGDPREGVVYTYTMGLQIGVHEYHFEFSDGKNQVRLPVEGEFQGPVVIRANYAPVLLQNEYEPSVGYRDTNFRFVVKYRDSHGDQPSKAEVIIDGEAYPMTVMGTNYQSGVSFIYETLLGLGDHGYHFEFTEGEFDVRFPETGEFEGPSVKNRAPQVVISHPSPFGEFADDEQIMLDASNSTDPDGDDMSYSWSSDIDGQLATGVKAFVTLSEGQHIITLTVDDGLGEQETADTNVIITHYEAKLNLVCSIKPTYPREDNEITATTTVSNSGNIASESFDIAFYLDGILLVDQPQPSIVAGRSKDTIITFRTSPGTHTLEVLIQGLYPVYVNFTTTERSPPVAIAGEDRTVYVGDQVSFDGSNSQIVGSPRLILWDFGDDLNQTGWTVTHIYFKPGIYNVTLTLVDDLDKTSIATIEVNVLELVDEENDPVNDEGSIGAGAIIGISLVSLVIAAGLVIGGFVIFKRKRQSGMVQPPSSMNQQFQQPSTQTGTAPVQQGQIGLVGYDPPLQPPSS
ncbi:MAG: PKD domain-containing protein, partial [Thermoplasmatota archaeon]